MQGRGSGGAVAVGNLIGALVAFWGVEKLLRALDSFTALATFGMLTLVTWGVAELRYFSFESRFLRLKARFAPGRPQ